MRDTENILFDLDGTITDPHDGIVNSILYALDHLGIKESNIDELDTFIGPPLRDSFIKRYNLTEETGDWALTLYREYFAVKGIYENRPYHGIDIVLAELSKTNYRIYLATSKPTVYAEKILKYFDLRRFFSGVTGSNLDSTRTDKSEVIAHMMKAAGLETKRTVMIGDRKHDIIGARNNNIKSIAVTYGYGSIQEIISEHPDLIIDNCRELIPVFISS